MIITRLPDSLDQLTLEAQPPRTPGLHLSQIIRSILQSVEPGKYPSGPVNTLYTDPGFTFERVLETAWASRQAGVFRPGEVTRDGIICSPDGIRCEGHDTILIESKMTEMSMVNCPTDPKFRKWIWQIGAYLSATYLNVAELHVLWLRGDYKKVRRAYTVDRIEFTEEEKDHTWALLVNHARSKGWLTQTPEGLMWSGALPLEK